MEDSIDGHDEYCRFEVITPEPRLNVTNWCHHKAVELGKLVVRMTTAAGSGHPSTALALAHIIVELMYRRMRYDPADPWNSSNDRLVLSLGHAVPIVYAAYADLNGAVGKSREHRRRLSLDELNSLREALSVLDGHPNPAEGFPFFDAATGSLGQGLSAAAGMALAARLDRIEKRIYAVIGDGESREGQVWEAVDFIIDHRLTNVCAIFSCNGHGQADRVSPQQSAERIAAKIKAFGWCVAEVDGHDPEALSEALDRLGTVDAPLAVIARTIKGWGVDLMQGRNYHGKPVPEAELNQALAELDATSRKLGADATDPAVRPPFPTRIPECPSSSTRTNSKGTEPRTSTFSNPNREPQKESRRTAADSRSESLFRNERTPPVTISTFEQSLRRCGLDKALSSKKLATRTAFGVALVALGDVDPRIVSLDADVSNSTYANLFAKHHPERFFECKIAEQNMVSAAVGLSAAGKIPFVSSFAKFIARGTDQIDMAGISRANLKIVGSHSGVSLAADGPSQMSLADVAYFRSMTRVDSGDGAPLCRLFHPSDAVSAYRCCELMVNVKGMCCLRTHRPEAPFVYSLHESFDLHGCKQLRRGDHLTLVGSGFMVHVVLEAHQRLEQMGIRCNVFDAYAFPLDPKSILDAAKSADGVILTVEDNFAGGLHSELAEAAASEGSIRVHGITVSRLPKSAKTPEEVFSHSGVGLEHIMEQAIRLMRR